VGTIPGSGLPLYQEVEFRGSSRFPRINQLEVTFLTSAAGTEVIIEADRRRGFLSSVRRLSVGNEPTGGPDARLEAAIQEVGRSRGLFG
jgi:hypothetical protein